MEYEKIRVKIDHLNFDKRNARIHSQENLAEIKRSLEMFGQYRPFVVQKGTNKVLVGNGMLSCMRELGWKEADAYLVDISDEQATKLALTDNRTSDLSEFNVDILKDLMQEMGPEPDIPGWTQTDIENMFYVPEFEEPDETKEGEAEMLQCPKCGHINEARAFRCYGKDDKDTE